MKGIMKGKQDGPKCYYLSYSSCTCTGSRHCDNPCVGKDECENFISENEFFEAMMNGELRDTAPTEDKKERQERINKTMALGKTKKQLKYEQREEAKKRGDGQGYTLFDDERFKDLFKNV